jgi:hypothetical protein
MFLPLSRSFALSALSSASPHGEMATPFSAGGAPRIETGGSAVRATSAALRGDADTHAPTPTSSPASAEPQLVEELRPPRITTQVTLPREDPAAASLGGDS